MNHSVINQSVVVPPSFMQRMIDHALELKPNECCGVLGGKGSVVTSVHPLSNNLNSTTNYFADPKDLFNAMRKMRQHGEEMIGIYHSHPNSAPEPSDTDRNENEYPDTYYFIISLQKQEPEVRCFMMTEDREFTNIQVV